MAAHARSQILAAVAALLTYPDAQKHISGVHNVPRAPGVPHVFVDWTSETVEQTVVMGAPVMQQRTLTVQITGFVQATEADLDEQADVMAERVERELADGAEGSSLAGLVESWQLQSAVKEFDGQGEKPVAKLTWAYVAVYRTRANAPGTIV